jgi:TetR/AcrR family transcriptional regulator
MPTRPLRDRTASGRPPTASEAARREQFIGATIDLVARFGWRSFTLQRVADEVGVTKAAVLYHVGSREELVRAAYARVITEFTASVGHRIEDAQNPTDLLELLLRAQFQYFRERPQHARVIMETLDADLALGDSPGSSERTELLTNLILAARNGAAPHQAGLLAVLINGALDAAIAAFLDDPTFDLAGAEGELIALLHAGLIASQRSSDPERA